MPTFTRGPYPSPSRGRSSFVRWSLAGALLFILIAAGCSGGGLALDPVASAADRTLDKQTGRFEMAVNVDIPQFGRTTIRGGGTFSNPDQAMQMTMDVPGIGTPTSSMELRMLYPMVYMHVPTFPLPNGKSWIKVDLRRALQKVGMNLPQPGGTQSPTDALGQLRGSKNAKKLGTDTIDGVRATHYRVKVDLDEALARATPQQRKVLQQLASTARRHGIDFVPKHVDVWVGDDGLVRRFNENFGRVGRVTMTFSDYGTPVAIEPPPPDETVDTFGLLKTG